MVRRWFPALAVSTLIAGLILGLDSGSASASGAGQQWFVAQSGAASFGSGTSCSAPDVSGTDDTAIRTVLDAVSVDDTITICDGVYSITQTLIIDDSITIQGESTAGSILDGGSAVQIIRVKDDSVLAPSPGEVHLLLTDLTLRNGNTGNNGTDACNTESQCGGAIYVESESDLTVRRSYFVDNWASFVGGAIANAGREGVWAGGNVRVEDSTFYRNIAIYDGGGIANNANYSSELFVVNSTFVENEAIVRDGGGISASFASGVITTSTFVDNRGSGDAVRGQYVIQGGLFAGPPGRPMCRDLISADDSSVSTGAGCGSATIVSRDSLNLRGLGSWGGSTPTVWIGPGSSAYDANGGVCPALDQRGATRSSPVCDAGAFERQGPSDEATTGTLDYPATLDIGASALPDSSPSFSGSGRDIGYMTLSASTCAVDANTGAATGVTAGSCELQWYLAPTLLLDGAAQDDSLAVQRSAQAPLVITSGTGPLVYGDSMNLTTSGGSGTGSVVFDIGASTGCYTNWWDPSTLYVSDPEGTCTITATKAADASYDAITSAPVTVVLQKAAQTPLEVVAPNYLSRGSTVALSTSGGSGSGDVSYSASPSDVCALDGGTLRALDYGVCRVTASKAGDFGYLPASSAPVSVEVTSPAPPDPTKAPSPPRDVNAAVVGVAVTVSWREPEKPGAFPVSTYQVISQPAGGTCLVKAPALSCEVLGLVPGLPYTFTVRALNGITWGQPSSPTEQVTIPRRPDPTIVISGKRLGRTVIVEGRVTGLDSGDQVRVWVRLGGRGPFVQGRSLSADDDGAFTWKRRTGKSIEVYFRADDVASNTIEIPRRAKK